MRATFTRPVPRQPLQQTALDALAWDRPRRHARSSHDAQGLVKGGVALVVGQHVTGILTRIASLFPAATPTGRPDATPIFPASR